MLIFQNAMSSNEKKKKKHKKEGEFLNLSNALWPAWNHVSVFTVSVLRATQCCISMPETVLLAKNAHRLIFCSSILVSFTSFSISSPNIP